MVYMYRKVRSLVYAESQELEKLGSLPPEVDVSLLVTEHTEMKTMYKTTAEWLMDVFRYGAIGKGFIPKTLSEFRCLLFSDVISAENTEKKARSEHKWSELGRLQAIRMGRDMAYKEVSDLLDNIKSLP